MADYEEEELLIKTKPEILTLFKNIGISSLVLFRKYFANRRSPTPHNATKISIQGVQLRIRCAILSSTMGAARISCQGRSQIV